MYKRGGIGLKQEKKMAVEWYRKAAAQGCINALLCLGNMYAQGKEIEKNSLKARRYYKMVEAILIEDAERGDASAQRKLAGLYEKGKIGETDYDKAVYWYKKAAVKGDAHAMKSLGELYLCRGNNNPEMAVKWLQEAASQGNDSAMIKLGTMYKSGNEVEQNYDKAIIWY